MNEHFYFYTTCICDFIVECACIQDTLSSRVLSLAVAFVQPLCFSCPNQRPILRAVVSLLREMHLVR